jgi:methylated-DNA-[protein]-cysteine S-methyltransferase
MKHAKASSSPLFCVSTATSFGPVAVVWHMTGETPGVRRIFLSDGRVSADDRLRDSFPSTSLRSCREVDSLIGLLLRFLDGSPVEFPLDCLALDRCSAFQRRVLMADRAIPRGRVSTYDRIGRHIGAPGAARAVGGALAYNPFPLVFPCHRAIRSDCTLGGYQGGLAMKRALLEMEGVSVSLSGKAIGPSMVY